MELYEVVVRNELTGEVETVSIQCTGGCDAQVQALHRMFHARGWRKASALPPSIAPTPALSEVPAVS